MTEQARILVVDDEPKNHDIMRRILASQFQLEHANSGEEALEKYADTTPDLILLDIMLPGIDGYEVCRRIKQDDGSLDTPIIFVSAKESVDERIKGYEAGGTDYFVKPFDHEELLMKVQRLLAARSTQRSLVNRVAEANTVAFQAMSATSELGMILNFLENSFAAKDVSALCDLLFGVTREMGLSCGIEVRADNTPIYRGDNGPMSPLEESVLNQLKNRGRLFDFKNRTVVNFPHVSLLIKNMPLDDPKRYGMIKDNICFLVSGADARTKAFVAAKETELQRQLLGKIVQQTHGMLRKLNGDIRQLRGDSYQIVEDMSRQINDVVPRLGLEEYQENSIFKITESCVTRTRDRYDASTLIDENFAQLVAQLSEISSDGELPTAQLLELIDRLDSGRG